MPSLLLELGLRSIAQVGSIGGLISLVFALMPFPLGPLLGCPSHRIGRQPVWITTWRAVGNDYAIRTVAGSLWLFLVARLVAGVTSASRLPRVGVFCVDGRFKTLLAQARTPTDVGTTP